MAGGLGYVLNVLTAGLRITAQSEACTELSHILAGDGRWHLLHV